jgi:hypothetical protein
MLLHFVSLEHNKMYLHVTDSTAWSDVLDEISYLDFCQQHLPERIVFSMSLTQDDNVPYSEQLDATILLFQELFGEEDTRGGTNVVDGAGEIIVTLETHSTESIETATLTPSC